jgi:hypothetical protein
MIIVRHSFNIFDKPRTEKSVQDLHKWFVNHKSWGTWHAIAQGVLFDCT